MFWFQYEYIKPYEIFINMTKLKDYWTLESISLVIWIIMILAMVFYIIPIIKIYFKQNLKEKEKQQKRKIINRIVLQKNLEDIIRKEIDEKKWQ